MNFQDLKKVEKPQFYLDVALNKAAKKADDKRNTITGKNRFEKSKQIEMIRIEVIESVLNEHLLRIEKSFPSIDQLDQFYQELIKLTLDYRDLKKSLGAVKWATKTIRILFKTYRSKLSRCSDMKFINKLRREYVGRVSSVVNQIKKNLLYLDECRKTMRSYPAVKTNMFTVCIFGFPNAGKSTLLKEMTNANPEVNSYAFTTKKLNFGYIKTNFFKIQVIDTPGTLNRKDKMNYIETQSHLALEHLANLVVYVFDPMFEYSLNEQEKLLRRISKDKEVLLYLSKTDIASKENIEMISKKYKILNKEELTEKLIKKVKVSQLEL